MKFPAHAFVEADPRNLALGQLFKFRGSWALRVSYREETQGFLLLTGERAGWVHEVSSGMGKVIAVAIPFSWFPAVSSDNGPTVDAAVTSTLMITEVGPVACGVEASSDSFDPARLAFRPDGGAQEIDSLHRINRYEQWSAELFHDSRPFVSLGTLFEVDRRGKQD